MSKIIIPDHDLFNLLVDRIREVEDDDTLRAYAEAILGLNTGDIEEIHEDIETKWEIKQTVDDGISILECLCISPDDVKRYNIKVVED